MPRRIRAYRALAAGLLFFIVTHGLGMLAMATLLRPGMDAGSFDALARMQYVASHPIAWRLGWVPWQLSTLSDAWVGVALVVWLGGRPGRGWAIAALALFVAGAIGEQWSEAMLETRFVEVARAGELDRFIARWRLHVWLTGVWAAAFYTLMTGAWMLAIRRACGRGAWPLALELALLAAFAAGTAFTHLVCVDPVNEARWLLLGGALNGLAFPAMTLWAVWVAARLGERARADAPGPSAEASALRWPRGRALRALGALASDGARDMLRILTRRAPYPTLRSDVRDVVYLAWMVPLSRVRPLVPPSIELEACGDRTPLVVLTYRHGGFGPALLGPLRRLLPSPAQSNWRLHQADGDGVFFLKTVLDHPAYVIGSRLLADGLPSHLPAAMRHAREGDTITTEIDPGDGSAPDLVSVVREVEDGPVPEAFRALGATTREVVERLVPRRFVDREHPTVALASRSFIDVGVDLDTVRAAEIVSVSTRHLAALVEGCAPMAFVLPSVRFRSTGEAWRPIA